MNTARSVAPRRRLALLVAAAAGLTVAGCANPTTVPGAQSTAPSSPALSSPPSAPPSAAALNWARSFCQTLHPVFGQLGAPPAPDLNNATATRESYVNYLGNARNATQQAIDRLPSIGPPPVANSLLTLAQIRNQLTALRDNLNDAAVQLNQPNPTDSGAVGRAFGAAGNVVGLLRTLATDPQLRAAINQAPECQNLSARGNSTEKSSGSPQPTG